MKKLIILFVLLTSTAQAQTYGSGPLPPNITTPCSGAYVQCVTALHELSTEHHACVVVLKNLGVIRSDIGFLDELEVRVFLSQQIPFQTVEMCYVNHAACLDTTDAYSTQVRLCYKQLQKQIKKVVR
jgi:hypothetical protein